nr:putative ribonuclease H-like domain-containing protein [Tanacetum cinerariifolium]
KFDGKADGGFFVGYSNTNDDTTFKAKEPESKVHVSLRNSAKTKKHDDKTKREAKGKIPVVGQILTNSTHTFSAAGPSNTVVSPTLGKSSYVDPSLYPDDPDMPALENITYSDDEEDVGAEAGFSNLETNITVSPILTTRVHKDHRVTQIIEEPKRVHQALKDPSWIEVMQEELLQFKMQKVWVLVDLPKDGKSASTPIDTEKPLLKDPNGEGVDVHTYRYLKGKPHLGLWYPKDSPFNLVAYSNSDYVGASLDKKSITFRGCRLISWQCKKQTVVATSSTEAEYVAATNASEGFEQIFDFLNASVIQYALTVNPTIYVSCIKQFWSSVSIKKTNDVVRLQALIDRRKRTAWNEFSSSMASAVICLATGRKFNFLKYIFDSLQAVDDIVTDDVATDDVATDDVADDVADEVANVVPTPSPHQSLIAPPSSHSPQQQPSHDAAISMDLLNTLLETWWKIAKLYAYEDVTLEEVAAVTKGAEVAKKDADVQGRQEESQAEVNHIDLEHVDKVLSMHDDEPEPAKLKEVIEVVTTAKLMTEVVTAAATISIAAPITASPITAAPSAARRRKGAVIRDPE